ncbi:MAG: hypothetical protein IKV70_02285 [Phascolarctobacterium sp.]|nr:hypothetical protein [Phascolarctobacterium sp.]
MKKNLAKKVTLSILAGAVLMSSSVVWAGQIIEPEPKIYWEYRDGIDGCVRLPANTKGDVSLVIEDYGDLDSAEAFYGAVSFEEGTTAANGIVTINDNLDRSYEFTGDIYGGRAFIDGGSDANNNKVYITTSKATIKSDVYGGYSDGGSVEKNSVTIEAGTFSDCYIDGGCSEGSNAEENSVTVTGGTISGCIIRGGSAYGGYAKGNSVTVKDGTFSDYEMTGGEANGGNAEGNSVTIAGGTFQGYMSGGASFGGDATGNSVTITGGTFTDCEIVGGASFGGDATGNTITISGSANLAGASLIGGSVSGAISTFAGGPSIGGGEVSGNTLNIGTDSSSWSGKVESILGFDTINFNNIAWEKDGTVVEVTEELELSDTEIKVGTVNIDGGTELANGDKMALISASDISGEISNNGEEVVINKGIAEQFNGYVEQNDTKIYLKLGDGPDEGYTVPGGSNRNDQVLVLGESRAAAVAFTNQGSELIETGLNVLARDNEKDTKVFAAVYGNHSEYETGSHVNVNGWSGIVGIGKTNADGLTVGAFFENGEGNYSTHNIFTNDYIRGDGEACYNGGGFLVRKDNANGVYTEASLRAGNLQNELRNAVRNGSELTGYDIDTFYYGAHVGIGKVIARGNDGDSIDVYGKFIYTHHDGETFDIGGTATKFDSVESERLRLGFRINEVQTNKLSMYYGAAWEYEFNGDAHDKIASFDLETPSLEGSTVIGEIGAHYKASDKWSIDLNGRAYVGQREGFSGSVQANYAF